MKRSDLSLKSYALIGVVFLFSFITSAQGQTYGLGFAGHETTIDERTELNLTPTDYLTFEDDFEIAFDFSILGSPEIRYGYVFRLIDRNHANIDVIYSDQNNSRNNINVVTGATKTVLKLQPNESNSGGWTSFKLRCLLSENKVIVSTPDTSCVVEDVIFPKENSYKLIFGANDLDEFTTSDVISMGIRDVKISEKGELKYHWPLDEKDGSIAKEKLNGREAVVKNPSWLAPKHQNWSPVIKKEIEGYSQVAVNIPDEKIYFIGQKFLYTYSVKDGNLNRLKYKNNPEFLLKGRQAVYSHKRKMLYSYNINNKLVFAFDFKTCEWNRINSPIKILPRYWHHNKLLNEQQDAIYLFGGYGQHRYKKYVQKIDLNNHSWDTIPMNDRYYSPRYLSALGATKDSIYILGGYGAPDGDQMINPQNYYDLLCVDIRNREIKYKFEIPRIIKGMCLANSMWIDEENRAFYALAFERFRYDGYLQMIKGSLDQPTVKKVGNKIPFVFMDITSYADLFYFPESKKLFAYTSLFSDSATTMVHLHSINYPPNESLQELGEAGEADLKRKHSWKFIIVFGLAVVFLIFLLLRKRKFKPVPVVEKVITSESDKKESTESSPIKSIQTDEKTIEPEVQYNFILFGGFQVFSASGNDVTNKFTPLLKELFLLIWLHTYKNNKGISSAKLTEYLWEHKSEKSAKNNRAVNIAKLRNILNELDECELTQKTGYWKIEVNNSLTCSDYVEFLSICDSKSKLTREQILNLMKVTSKGAFLSHVNYEWLDDFKSAVSDNIVDLLVTFGESCSVHDDADFIIHLADSVFNFDDVNEEAMTLKCKAQNYKGNHSLAEDTYRKFSRKYMLLYGEKYSKTFVEIVGESQIY